MPCVRMEVHDDGLKVAISSSCGRKEFGADDQVGLFTQKICYQFINLCQYSFLGKWKRNITVRATFTEFDNVTEFLLNWGCDEGA